MKTIARRLNSGGRRVRCLPTGDLGGGVGTGAGHQVRELRVLLEARAAELLVE